MNSNNEQVLSAITEAFRLEALACMADLRVLARQWGVTSIVERDISAEAMLLPNRDGYTVILKEGDRTTYRTRQRFSMAHELGHLLLHRAGVSDKAHLIPQYRSGSEDEEERLCDAIAAEILMPRLAFEEDAWMEGWSLRSLRTLSRAYDASMTATARRMIKLMPEVAVMSVWKPPLPGSETLRLQWSDRGRSNCGVPSPSVVPMDSLKLVTRALKGSSTLVGTAPLMLEQRGNPRPTNVPAEALSWGRDEYHQAMVFYYPERIRSHTP
jgi:hypothetical protein